MSTRSASTSADDRAELAVATGLTAEPAGEPTAGGEDEPAGEPEGEPGGLGGGDWSLGSAAVAVGSGATPSSVCAGSSRTRSVHVATPIARKVGATPKRCA